MKREPSSLNTFSDCLWYFSVVPGQDSDVVVIEHEDGTEQHIAVPAGTVSEGDDPANLTGIANNHR